MKTALQKVLLIVALGISSSCAMIFNEKEVEVKINSEPAGADIFIDGINHGRTPAALFIVPKTSTIVLTKAGYGSTQAKLEAWEWGTIRKTPGDYAPCLADAFFSWAILPLYSLIWSGKCDDFKQGSYFFSIPRNGGYSGDMPKRNSMMGAGNNAEDMINYYYQQNLNRRD